MHPSYTNVLSTLTYFEYLITVILRYTHQPKNLYKNSFVYVYSVLDKNIQ
jgi:hypothetical protein